MKEKRLALEMVQHLQDNHPQKRLKKRLIFTLKWTTAWHHSVGDASFRTLLQSFQCPNNMEEKRPSLETPI